MITIDDIKRCSNHSFILSGIKGCGKHKLVEEFAKDSNYEIINISDNVYLDTLNNIQESSQPLVIIIDKDLQLEKVQNTILKFLEEPRSYIYTFLLCEDYSILLQTIQNRCTIFSIVSRINNAESIDDNLLSMCKNDYEVSEYLNLDFMSIKNLSNKIIENIQHASLPNTLKLTSQILNIDTSGKYFIKYLLYSIQERIRTDRSDLYLFKLFSEFSKCLNNLNITNIDIKKCINNALIKVKL